MDDFVHLHLRYKYLTIQNVFTMTAHTSDDLLDAYTVAKHLSIKNMFKSPATPIITSNDAQENVPDEE
jgi:hypothetical protein